MTVEQEIADYLRDYPDTQVVEILIADINGIFRGKQVPVDTLAKIANGGVYFPITTSFLTTNGANAELTLDEFGSDPDRRCQMVPGTLKPVPWALRPTAQVMVETVDKSDEDKGGAAFFANPRTVMARVLAQLSKLSLTPVVAFEYEFFLFEVNSQPPQPLAPPNGMPKAKDTNCYNLDVYKDFEPLLAEIEQAALAQGINVTNFVCEYGNGQFEVNLNHSPDAMRACDEAMMLKRVIRGVAHRHGLLASFMAKPLYDEVGNGLHVHVSLLNDAGQNIFAADDGEERLKHALGGLLDTMPAATPFFAPNANSYRRFDAEWFAPVVRNWGENNRRLSLRLPMSDTANRRFEHRVSGADASPHLVLAAILAGAHRGLVEKLDPGAPLGEFDLVDFKDVLPSRWKKSLDTLRADTVFADYFGSHFVELYLQVKESEEEEFHCAVTTADYDQYLRVL